MIGVGVVLDNMFQGEWASAAEIKSFFDPREACSIQCLPFLCTRAAECCG